MHGGEGTQIEASGFKRFGVEVARPPSKLGYKYRYRDGRVTIMPSREWVILSDATNQLLFNASSTMKKNMTVNKFK